MPLTLPAFRGDGEAAEEEGRKDPALPRFQGDPSLLSNAASRVEPEAAGAHRRTGRSLGITPESVAAEPAEAKALERERAITSALGANPVLGRVATDPERLSLLTDDAEVLGRMNDALSRRGAEEQRFLEQSAFERNVESPAKRAFFGAKMFLNTQDLLQSAERLALLRDDSGLKPGEFFEGAIADVRQDAQLRGIVESAVLGDVAIDAADLREAKAALDELPRDVEFEEAMEAGLGATAAALVEDPSRVWRLGIEGLVTSAPALAVGIIAGPMGAAGASFAIENAAGIQEALQRKGIDLAAMSDEDILAALSDPALREELAQAGAAKGAGVALWDLIGAGVASRVLAPSRIAGRPLGKLEQQAVNLLAQVPVQGVTEAAGEATGQLFAFGEVDPVEVLLEGVAGGAMSTVDVAVFGGRAAFLRSRAAVQKGVQRRRVKQALDGHERVTTESVDAVEKVLELAQATKLKERDPELLAEYVAEVLKEGPDTLYVAPEAIEAYAGDDLPGLLERLGVKPDVYEDVTFRGSYVEVSVATLVRIEDGQEFLRAVREDAKVAYEGVTPAEAKVIREMDDAMFAAAVSALSSPVADDSAEAVYRDIFQQVMDTGRFNETQARSYAALWRAAIANMASKAGTSPEALYERIRPDITTGARQPRDARAAMLITQARARADRRARIDEVRARITGAQARVESATGEVESSTLAEDEVTLARLEAEEAVSVTTPELTSLEERITAAGIDVRTRSTAEVLDALNAARVGEEFEQRVAREQFAQWTRGAPVLEDGSVHATGLNNRTRVQVSGHVAAYIKNLIKDPNVPVVGRVDFSPPPASDAFVFITPAGAREVLNQARNASSELLPDLEDQLGEVAESGLVKGVLPVDVALRLLERRLLPGSMFDDLPAVRGGTITGARYKLDPEQAMLLANSLSDDELSSDDFDASVARTELRAAARRVQKFRTGQPVVVKGYHGSNSPNIEQFAKDLMGHNTGAPSAGLGFFFSGTAQTAESYVGHVEKHDQQLELRDFSEDDQLALVRKAVVEFEVSFEVRDADAEVKHKLDRMRRTVGRDLTEREARFIEQETREEFAGATVRVSWRGVVTKIFHNVNLETAEEASIRGTNANATFVDSALDSGRLSVTSVFIRDMAPGLGIPLPQEIAPTIYPAYVRMNNPLVFDYGGSSYRERSYFEVITNAKREGHDGVILTNTRDGGPRDNIFVVFEPQDIAFALPVGRARDIEGLQFAQGPLDREPPGDVDVAVDTEVAEPDLPSRRFDTLQTPEEFEVERASLPEKVRAYRDAAEREPLPDDIGEPIRNKDGSYRRNAAGDITGAPPGVKTEADVTSLVDRLMALILDPLAQADTSAVWYEESGRAIRDITGGDPALMERMVRTMAMLSADNQVGGNVTGMVRVAYQLQRGETPSAGRYPNLVARQLPDVLLAREMTLDLRGVERKVLSFYRNLWDATFASNRFENALTIDLWMYRLAGYEGMGPDSPGSGLGSAPYKFMNMVISRVAERFNAQSGASLKPHQVQAVLWVYQRTLETLGPDVDLEGIQRNNFATYIDRARQHITVEAVTHNVTPPLQHMTFEEKERYTREAVALMTSNFGDFELFAYLGIPLGSSAPGTGAFDGVVSPNTVIDIIAEKVAGKTDTEKADLASIILLYAFAQDAVPWMQFDPTAKGASTGWAMELAREMTPEEQQAFLAHYDSVVGGGAGFTIIGGDLVAVNFRGPNGKPFAMSDRKFEKALQDAVDSYSGPGEEALTETIRKVKVRSNYLSVTDFHKPGWSDPDGAKAALEGVIGQRAGPAVLSWARSLRSRVGRLNEAWGRALARGEGDARVGGRPGTRADGRVQLDHWSGQRGLNGLDPAKHGSGLGGAELRRKREDASEWVDRTYYGLEVDKEGGYVRESNLGLTHYVTSIEPERLYDLGRDPDGLRGDLGVTAYERAVRDAGYAGYWVDSQMGRVAALFEPALVESEEQEFFQEEVQPAPLASLRGIPSPRQWMEDIGAPAPTVSDESPYIAESMPGFFEGFKNPQTEALRRALGDEFEVFVSLSRSEYDDVVRGGDERPIAATLTRPEDDGFGALRHGNVTLSMTVTPEEVWSVHPDSFGGMTSVPGVLFLDTREVDITRARIVGGNVDATGRSRFQAPEGALENTKVLDSEGRPLAVFHFTAAAEDFDVFDTDAFNAHFGDLHAARTRGKDTASSRQERETGSRFSAPEVPEGGRFVPVFLNIEQPLRSGDAGNWRDAGSVIDTLVNESNLPEDIKQDLIDIQEEVQQAKDLHRLGFAPDEDEDVDLGAPLEESPWTRSPENRSALDEVKSLLEIQGYDGIIYSNAVEGGISYIAFNPEQVKSAIGNVGTFDPERESILLQRPEGTRDDMPELKVQLAKPNESREERMEMFDALPREIRDALNDSNIAWSPRGFMSFLGLAKQRGIPKKEAVSFAVSRIKAADRMRSGVRQKNRGSFRINADRTQRIISLFEGADASTFLHESAHFFLEVVRDLDLAGQYDRDEVSAIFKFLGVGSWDDIGVRQHEMFAEGFEKYLFEGKAPSEDLRGPFRRFADWMRSIYGAAKRIGLTGVKLDDEVRAIYDRLLAGHDAIDAERERPEYLPAFDSAEAAGMTEAEFERYRALAGESVEGARERVMQRLMKDIARRRTKERRGRLTQVMAEVEGELRGEPVWQALEYLRNRRLIAPEVEDEAGVEFKRLDESSVRAVLGPEVLTLLPPITVKSDGLDVDEVADTFGFRTGAEMLQAILGLGEVSEDGVSYPSLKQAVRRRAEALLDQEEGTTLDPDRLRAAASEALHDADRGELLALELRILEDLRAGRVTRRSAEREVVEEGAGTAAERRQAVADAEERLRQATQAGDEVARQDAARLLRQARQRADVARVQRESDRASQRRSREALKTRQATFREMARRYVEQMAVGDLGRLGRLLQDERKAAAEAASAIAAKDYNRASLAKQRQLFNHFAYAEAVKAKESLEVARRLFSRWAKVKVPGKVQVANEYVNALQTLLAAHNVGPRRIDPDEARAGIGRVRDFVTARNADGDQIVIPDSVYNARNLDTVSVREANNLKDAVRSLVKWGRANSEEARQEFLREMQELAEHIEANVGARRDREELSRVAAGTRDFVDHMMLAHRKAEHLMVELDGFEDLGPMWRAVFDPIQEASNVEEKMRDEALGRMKEVWQRLRSLDKKGRRVKTYIAGLRLTREEMIVIGLNWGNEGNREAMLNGSRNWNREQLERVIAELTDEEWDFIEATWGFINSYWPDIAALEQRLTGVTPEKVEGDVFTLPSGRVIQGQYYPIKFDPKQSPGANADAIQDQARMLMSGDYSRPMTSHGFTNERVGSLESGKRVHLSLDVMFRHVDDVIHDLSHREAVLRVSKVLASRPIQEALSQRYGVEVNRYLNRWLKNVAAGTVTPQDFYEIVFRRLRVGMSVAEMGMSIRTALVQPMGITQSVARIGPVQVLKGVMAFIGDSRGNPFARVAWVNEKSPAMLARSKTFDRDIAAASRRLQPGDKLDRLKDASFWLIGKLDMMVSYSSWLGAYDLAINQRGMSDADAVKFADQIVRTTQGSGLAKDLPDITAGGETKRLFTGFMTFFTAYHNMVVDALKRTGRIANRDGVLYATTHAAGQFLMLVVMPAVVSALALDGGPDEDDEEEWWAWATKVIVGYGLSGMVVIRDVMSGITSDFGYSGPTGVRPLVTVVDTYKQVAQGEVDKALVRGVMMSGGYMLHLPTRQGWRAIEALWDYEEGEATAGEAAAGAIGLRHFKQ